MRRNERSVKNVLNALFDKGTKGHDQFVRAQIKKYWIELMGESVSKRTQRIIYRNEILEISIDSAPLRHQLSHNKAQIVYNLNKLIGEEKIKEIRLY